MQRLAQKISEVKKTFLIESSNSQIESECTSESSSFLNSPTTLKKINNRLNDKNSSFKILINNSIIKESKSTSQFDAKLTSENLSWNKNHNKFKSASNLNFDTETTRL